MIVLMGFEPVLKQPNPAHFPLLNGRLRLVVNWGELLTGMIGGVLFARFLVDLPVILLFALPASLLFHRLHAAWLTHDVRPRTAVMASAAQLAAAAGVALTWLLSWLPVLPFVALLATGIGVIVGPLVARRPYRDADG